MKTKHLEKIFIIYVFAKVLVQEICKELFQFNNKKTTQFLKWAKIPQSYTLWFHWCNISEMTNFRNGHQIPGCKRWGGGSQGRGIQWRRNCPISWLWWYIQKIYTLTIELNLYTHTSVQGKLFSQIRSMDRINNLIVILYTIYIHFAKCSIR